MKVGFIGLGIMGRPMAGHLAKAGHTLFVYNRSRAAVDALTAQGAVACGSPREAAERSDVIVTMLPDSPQVKEVVLGENGVVEGLAPGSIVIDMSSINPAVARELAEAVAARGVAMLDAPVSGGEAGAISARLSIMVGGDEAAFAQARPLLETMGSTVIRVGGIGAGQTVKLMNQMMVAVHLAAASEAFAFGRQCGVDLELAYMALKDGLAGSRVLEAKRLNWLEERYEPGFRAELHWKDLRNALQFNETVGADLRLTPMLERQFAALAAQGFGAEDHSALYRLYASSGADAPEESNEVSDT